MPNVQMSVQTYELNSFFSVKRKDRRKPKYPSDIVCVKFFISPNNAHKLY
jgi:hypothetical protein